jgi:hypothetical protein
MEAATTKKRDKFTVGMEAVDNLLNYARTGEIKKDSREDP